MNAIRHLQNLIRLNTSNPPGNEILAADYLAGVLAGAEYEPRVIESEPGRGSVIARYNGDAAKRPLLLFNHLDVVPVETDEWTHNPFGGEIADGYVWGRGALDMKNIVTQQLIVMLRLAAERPALKRDVIFAGCADEEVSGKFGLEYLVKNHADLIDAEIGLSESGAIPIYLNGNAIFPIQCGEKGNRRLVLRAKAAPGHGASPNYDHYAIRYLAIAIERLTRSQLPTHITPTMELALRKLAPLIGLDPDEFCDPARMPALLPRVPSSELRNMIYNSTRNSAAPTILQAGVKANVVPSVAEVTLDGRVLPGQTTADIIAEVRAAIGSDLPVEIVHLAQHDSNALESPAEGPIWDTLVRNIRKRKPEAIVVPNLLAGGTDAKSLAPLGVRTFGFSPMDFSPDFDRSGLVHGHDERIPVDSLDWGIDVLYDTVLELCS
ncbi:MAG: M20/M25/M40 family metallo-hydrolase [Caldilineales bacterium]|nr:M20/M25/M40 family metallo-hydrolase [Caldilineales bacterium]